MNEILKFIEEWQLWCSKVHDLYIMPITYGGNVYQIDIRFPATEYHCSEDEFFNIANAMLNRTNGTLRIVTGLSDYHSGSLRFEVEFANQGFDEACVVNALRFLVNSILPAFRKGHK